MAEMPRYSSFFSGEPGASLRPHHTAGCTGLYPAGGGDIWQCTLGPGRWDLEETGALGSEEGIPLPLVTGELCHLVLTFYLVCLILSAIRAVCLLTFSVLPPLVGRLCPHSEQLPVGMTGRSCLYMPEALRWGSWSPVTSPPVPTQKTLSAWENKQEITSWWVFWVFL